MRTASTVLVVNGTSFTLPMVVSVRTVVKAPPGALVCRLKAEIRLLNSRSVTLLTDLAGLKLIVNVPEPLTFDCQLVAACRSRARFAPRPALELEAVALPKRTATFSGA